jgi:hypothetical protein
VPIFVLPALIWNAHYILTFKLLMTACGIGFTICAVWIVRRLGLSRWRLVPVVAAPVLMGPVFLNRYDPVPALLSAIALVMLLRGRDRTVGALLGAGAAAKIYPLAVLPVVARRVRSLTESGAALLIAGAVLVLPWFVIAPGGVGFSLWTQLKRHLQSESVGAAVLVTLSKLHVHHFAFIDGAPGSIDISGTTADTIGLLSSIVAVALALWVARVYWLGPDTEAQLVLAFAASVTAFTVFGKVLSPQYLTWLVPLVPLASGRKGAYAAWAFLVSLALTQPEYIVDKYGERKLNWVVWALMPATSRSSSPSCSWRCSFARALGERDPARLRHAGSRPVRPRARRDAGEDPRARRARRRARDLRQAHRSKRAAGELRRPQLLGADAGSSRCALQRAARS